MTWRSHAIAALAFTLASEGWGQPALSTEFGIADVPPFESALSANGLAGWRVPLGSATVAPFSDADGGPALFLPASSEARWQFPDPGHSTLWMVTRVRSAGGLMSLSQLPPRPIAAAIGLDTNQGLVALDGDGEGGGVPHLLGVTLDGESWHEIAIRHSYRSQIYDVYIDGTLRGAHLGFRDPISAPEGIGLGARDSPATVGHVSFSATPPPGIVYRRGDVRIDGVIDVTDLVTLINSLNGGPSLTALQTLNADLNEDGAVTVTDRELLADLLAGVELP